MHTNNNLVKMLRRTNEQSFGVQLVLLTGLPLPPQKSQRFTVLFLDVDLMKHLLYVNYHGYYPITVQPKIVLIT